jgi:hypothetical protein
MKRTWLAALAVGLLASAALAGAELTEPMKHLQQAINLIAQDNHKAAVEELTWCFDKGAQADEAFIGIRNTYVIDLLASVSAKYAPAKEALRIRRDAAMAKVGDPPRVSQDFFDVLALNSALGDTAANDTLIRKAGVDPGVKNFAATVVKPKVSSASGQTSDVWARAEKSHKTLALDVIRDEIIKVKRKIQLAESEIADTKRRYEEIKKELDRTVEAIGTAVSPQREELMAKASSLVAALDVCGMSIAQQEKDMALLVAELSKLEAKSKSVSAGLSTP